MIATTTFSTKEFQNQLAKSRLSQNRHYRENGTRQITVSFSLSRATNLKKPHHPETVHAYFKTIYNEAIDTIINSIQNRFEQPGIKVFGQVEQLFIKSANKEDHSDEIMTFESTFRGDYHHDSLITELQLLPVLFDDCKAVSFGDIVKGIQLLFRDKRKLIRNAVLIARLILTNHALSATPNFLDIEATQDVASINSEAKEIRLSHLAEREPRYC